MCEENVDEYVNYMQSLYEQYNTAIACIYNSIPNNWQKNTCNSHNKIVNEYITKTRNELNNLLEIFPGREQLSMGIFGYNVVSESEDKTNINLREPNFTELLSKFQNIKKNICSIIENYKQVLLQNEKRDNERSNVIDRYLKITSNLMNYNDFIENQIVSDNIICGNGRKRFEKGINNTLSVVIPAYNAIETINRALESIAKQTILDYIKVNVYIVNDCSDYDYNDIVNLYANFMNVYELKTEKNIGPGLARQLGINTCNDDYIIFLDADDYFCQENSLEKLFLKITETKSDIVTSNFKELWRDGNYCIKNNMGWLHGKMYNVEFIKSNKIEFIDSRATEDAAFNMLFKLYNPKMEDINEVTYVWADNELSITRKNNYEFSYKFIESYSENIRKILQISIDRNINIRSAMEDAFNALFVIWTNYLTFKSEEQKEQILKWTKNLKITYDSKCKEYINEDTINAYLNQRRELYSDRWTKSYTEARFKEFLKKIDEVDLQKGKLVRYPKKQMNILVSVNEDYVCHLVDMLTSIMLHNDVYLRVYLLYNNLYTVSINSIKDFLEVNNYGELCEIYIDSNMCNFPKMIQYIPDVTYYRLFAPFIINDDIDRILYLDSDVVVTGNIEELYNAQFDNNILIGCRNMLCDEKKFLNDQFNRNLGLPVNNPYINAGVILINVKAYRNSIDQKTIIDFIDKNGSILMMQDQDIINKLFYKKIKIVGNQYNFQINAVDENFTDDDIRIVHYSQRAKPWHSDYYSIKKAKYYYSLMAQMGETQYLDEIVNSHLGTFKKSIIDNALNNR